MMHKRSKDLGTVVFSVNMTGESICVDLFQRPDGSFGYEEYRRDAETSEGWFPIGFHAWKSFTTLEAAKADALAVIIWLRDEI